MSDQNNIIDQELFQLTEEEEVQIGRSKWQIIKAQIASFIYAIILLINTIIESYIGHYGFRFFLLLAASLVFLGISLSASKYPRSMLSLGSLIAVLFFFKHIFLMEDIPLASVAWTGILLLILLIGLMHAYKIRRIKPKR